MARNLDDAMEKFGQGDGGEFFSLKNDRDAAVVRFLHDADQLEFDKDWFVLHEVEIQGKKRKVRCPDEEGHCPLCDSGNKAQLKVFLQLVTKDDGKRKLWERGKTFVPKIRGLLQKYGSLCNRPYEIERHGKAGSTETTYEIYPLDRDDKRLEDIAVERQDLLESFILVLSEDDMYDVVDGRYRLPERNSNSRGRDDRRDSDRGRGRDDRRDDRDRGGRDRDDRRDDRRDSDRDRDRDRDRRDDDRGRDRDRDEDRRSDSKDRGRDRDESDRNDRDRGRDDRGERGGERRREKSGSDVF